MSLGATTMDKEIEQAIREIIGAGSSWSKEELLAEINRKLSVPITDNQLREVVWRMVSRHEATFDAMFRLVRRI